MNITLFNKKYWVRRFKEPQNIRGYITADHEDFVASLHIEKIVNALEALGDEVESLRDDEQEKFDNAPEGLEGSERYAAIEAAADNLDTAHDNITEAIEALRATME